MAKNSKTQYRQDLEAYIIHLLFPRATKSSSGAFGFRQFVGGFPFHGFVAGDDHLGDAVAGADGEGHVG